MFYVQFILTKDCNKNCSYCDLLTKNISQHTVSDYDLFEWVVGNIPSDNLYVELTGGEPGLVKNLSKFIGHIISSNKIKLSQIMSNGLVRLNHPELLSNVDYYNEHLVSSIMGKNINKFYDIDFRFEDNTKTVIVLDEITTNSIIDNYSYFKEYGLFDEDNFWLKLFVERTYKNSFKSSLIKLLSLVDSDSSRHNIKRINGSDEFSRKVCSCNPYLPCIDLVDKKIIHCAYHNYTDVTSVDLTKENINKLIKGRLFTGVYPKYCDSCYHYFDDPLYLMKNKGSNIKYV